MTSMYTPRPDSAAGAGPAWLRMPSSPRGGLDAAPPDASDSRGSPAAGPRAAPSTQSPCWRTRLQDRRSSTWRCLAGASRRPGQRTVAVSCRRCQARRSRRASPSHSVGPSGVLGGLNLFDFGAGTWTAVSASTEPSARRGASATPYTNTTTQSPCLILYGGEDAGEVVSGEVWRFCLASGGGEGTWTRLSPSGQASLSSRHHSAVILGGRILVFGGYSGTFPVDYRAAPRQYDYRLNRWEVPVVEGSAPPGRSQHASVAVRAPDAVALHCS